MVNRVQDHRSRYMPAPPPSRVIYLWLFCAAGVLSVLASFRTIWPVLHGNLVDPDSFMRLLRIQQGLRTGHLVNIVNRDDSGSPLILEWSRLFDAAIVALAAPLVPLIGWRHALFVSGVATGPISTGLLGASLGFAAAPVTQRRFIWAAAVIAPIVPGIRNFSAFGVIHYHIAQAAAVAITSGCALRSCSGHRVWAAMTGITGGMAIWLMPETMPWVLLAQAGLGWYWLFRPPVPPLLINGAAFFATLAAALAVDPPHGGYLTPEIDRLSIVYVGLGLAILLVTFSLARLDKVDLPTKSRNLIGIFVATCIFLAWLAIFPHVALGPFGLMSASEMHIFFGSISETQPARTASQVVGLLGPGILACTFAITQILYYRRRLLPVGAWSLFMIGTVLATGLTARFLIFQQYPSAFLCGILPIMLDRITTRLGSREHYAAAGRVGLVAVIVLGPIIADAAPKMLWNHAKIDHHRPTCSMRHIAHLLAPAADQIVLTRPGEVPELLYRTQIIGVGSLYQHGVRAFLRDWAAWRANADHKSEPAAVRASGARYVLFCPAGKSYPIAQKSGPEALWTMLSQNRTPPWLKKIGQQKSSGFRLYQIVTDGRAQIAK